MILQEIDKTGMKKGHKLQTTALFVEFASDPATALYSIKPEPFICTKTNTIFPSLHKLFVEFGDPTEYYFANAYFLSLAHWREVFSHPQILPYVHQWREELELKVKADALRAIVKAAQGEGKDAIQAARYLLQQEWFKHANKPSTARGRPSKDRTADIPLYDDKAMLADLKRVVNTKLL